MVELIDNGGAIMGSLVLGAIQVLVGVWYLPLGSQEGKMHVLREREVVEDSFLVYVEWGFSPRIARVAACDISNTRVWLRS